MATYEKRVAKRDGHITYGIQIKVKDFCGNDKFVNTTWKNPDNLTGERAKKAAIAFGERWEKDYKSGHKSKLNEALFIQVANDWLSSIKADISLSYYLRSQDCIKRMAEFFGEKRFADISSYDVTQLFIYLNDYEYEKRTAIVKADRLAELDKILTTYGLRKAEREGILSRPSLYYARKGQPIALTSAEKICKELNLPFNRYFDKVIIKQHYAKNTLLKYQRTLSAIFNFAIINQICTANYASGVYMKKKVGGRKPEEAKVLTDEEYKNFIDELISADKEVNEKNEPLNKIWETIPLYFMSLLGLRTCEICGLQWNDIDLENRVVSIMRDRIYVSGKGTFDGATKTKSSERKLYIDDLLFQKIQEYKALYDKVKEGNKKFATGGYIFCGLDGKPRFPQYLNVIFQKYLAKAGCKKISNHKMRHTLITRLITNGAPVNLVSQTVGHADKTTTLKIYTHCSKDVDASKVAFAYLFK